MEAAGLVLAPQLRVAPTPNHVMVGRVRRARLLPLPAGPCPVPAGRGVEGPHARKLRALLLGSRFPLTAPRLSCGGARAAAPAASGARVRTCSHSSSHPCATRHVLLPCDEGQSVAEPMWSLGATKGEQATRLPQRACVWPAWEFK